MSLYITKRAGPVEFWFPVRGSDIRALGCGVLVIAIGLAGIVYAAWLWKQENKKAAANFAAPVIAPADNTAD